MVSVVRVTASIAITGNVIICETVMYWPLQNFVLCITRTSAQWNISEKHLETVQLILNIYIQKCIENELLTPFPPML